MALMAGQAGMKGGEQGLAALQRIRMYSDEMKGRTVLSYLTGLQAAVAANPDLARQGLDDLQQFVTRQGMNMPASVTPWVERTLGALNQARKVAGVKQALSDIGPNGGPQLQAAVRMISAGADPDVSIEMGKLWSNKETTMIQGRDGNIYQATKDPETAQISLTNINPPDYTPTGPALALFRTLPSEVKGLITSDASHLPGGSIGEFMGLVMKGDERANALLSTYHERARVETEAKAEKATERAIQKAEEVRDMLPPATRGLLRATEKMFPGTFRNQTRWSEVTESDQTAMAQYQMQHASDIKVRDALLDPKSGVSAFTKDGQKVPVNTQNVEAVIKGRGTEYFVTDRVTGERVVTLQNLETSIRNYNAVAQTVLKSQADLPAGTSFFQAAQFAFSKRLIPNDMKWMEDEAGDLGFRISKALFNSARSNMMGEAGRKILPMGNDSKELAAQKTFFALQQVRGLWEAELGLRPDWRLDVGDAEAAIPALRGKFSPGDLKPGATVGPRPSGLPADLRPRTGPPGQGPGYVAPRRSLGADIKRLMSPSGTAADLMENILP